MTVDKNVVISQCTSSKNCNNFVRIRCLGTLRHWRNGEKGLSSKQWKIYEKCFKLRQLDMYEIFLKYNEKIS